MMIERRKSLQIIAAPRLYTLQDLAEYFHVPLATVRFWRSMRRFPVVKVGRKALVEHGDLLALVAAFKQPGAWSTQPVTEMGGDHGQA